MVGFCILIFLLVFIAEALFEAGLGLELVMLLFCDVLSKLPTFGVW